MIGQMALGAGDYLAISSMLGTFVAAPITAMVWYVRSMKIDTHAMKEDANRRMEALDVRLRDIDERKLDKCDWTREQVRVADKLDHMSEQLAALGQRIESELGVAKAIKGLSETVRDAAERIG